MPQGVHYYLDGAAASQSNDGVAWWITHVSNDAEATMEAKCRSGAICTHWLDWIGLLDCWLDCWIVGLLEVGRKY